MEIVEDVNRAVRDIRHHARDYGVDPQHLGVTGGSAGGHLSLMLATRGGLGPADAADFIDCESSVVQAVAIFFPVTDLLNLGNSTENPGDGGPPKSFVRAFGPQSTNLAVWKVIGHEVSPIYSADSNLPPVLICHGDADTLVPLDQSDRFQAEAQRWGCLVELVVRHGGGHWCGARFGTSGDSRIGSIGTCDSDPTGAVARSPRPTDGAHSAAPLPSSMKDTRSQKRPS
jgi:acetyl esterase/lipase